MAFKLKKDNTFTVPVSVKTPIGGEIQEWSFDCEMRIATEEDVRGAKDHLDVIVVKVSGVEVDDMEEKDVIAYLKKRPDTRNAILSAYQANVIKKNQGNSFLQ